MAAVKPYSSVVAEAEQPDVLNQEMPQPGNAETPPEEPQAAQPQAQPEAKQEEQPDGENYADGYAIDLPEGYEVKDDEPTPINYTELFSKADDSTKKQILESFGIDKFALELNEHLKKGGAASDYLNAKAVNWDDVPDEKLIKADLKTQYPSLDDDKIHRLYESKYKQSDLNTEEENEVGQILIEADAAKIRAARKLESENFKIPEKAMAEQTNNQADAFFKYISGHDITKEIQQSKRVAVDTGDGVIYFPLQNPNLLVDIITNKNGVGNRFGVDKQGYPDVQLIHEMALMKANPTGFKKALIDRGRKLERESVIEEGQHISTPKQSLPGIPQADEKAAWRSGARVVPYSQIG